MQFKIVSIENVASTSFKVRVRMDAKEWLKIKKQNGLGMLYGVDISNEVHSQTGIKAYNPSVSDQDRAQGGIKWLTLYYTDATWTPAPNNVVEVDFITRRKVA
jgi:hypothetical protein